MSSQRIIIAIAFSCMLCAGCHKQQPLGKLDPLKVGEYFNRLNESDSPRAREIKANLKSGSKDLADARAEAHGLGIAISPADLTLPAIPLSEDAAPLYQQLSAAFRQVGANTRLLNSPMTSGYSYPPDVIGSAEAELQANQELVRIIHEAASKPECSFQRVGPSQFSPDFALMRAAARILSSESYLLARKGRLDDALKSMERGFRIARHASSDPTLIGFLVEKAIDAITIHSMMQLLYMAGPNASFSKKVRHSIAVNRHRTNLRRALGREYVEQAMWMQTVRDGPPKDFVALFNVEGKDESQIPAAWNPEVWTYVRQLVDAAEAHGLNVLIEQFKASGLDSPTRHSRMAQLAAADERESDNPIFLISSIVSPIFAQASDSETRAEAQARAVIVAADLLAYRAKSGHFPTRLEQVQTSKPPDPFSGKPMRYRKESGGFVVYSVGSTGNFDGGKPGMKRNSQEAYFRYPPPPPTPYTPLN